MSRAEVSILLCGDRRMRNLNRQHRGLDRTTDVLSFPMWDRLPSAVDHVLLGDIAISAPRAALQARQLGHSLGRELDRLVVHGMLHLIGYDHERSPRQAAKMRAKEGEILRALCGNSRRCAE